MNVAISPVTLESPGSRFALGQQITALGKRTPPAGDFGGGNRPRLWTRSPVLWPRRMSTTANWAADLASYVASLPAPSREELLAALPPGDAMLIRAALWRMTVRARRFHDQDEGRSSKAAGAIIRLLERFWPSNRPCMSPHMGRLSMILKS